MPRSQARGGVRTREVAVAGEAGATSAPELSAHRLTSKPLASLAGARRGPAVRA